MEWFRVRSRLVSGGCFQGLLPLWLVGLGFELVGLVGFRLEMAEGVVGVWWLSCGSWIWMAEMSRYSAKCPVFLESLWWCFEVGCLSEFQILDLMKREGE